MSTRKYLPSLSAFLLSMAIPGVSLAQPLLNVNFTADKNPASQLKTGPAAIGFQANDYWNVYSRDVYGPVGWRSEGTIGNLRWADGSACTASVSVANAAGFWVNGSADAMFNTFLYPASSGNISIYVRNLPAGNYTIQLYGHGPLPSQNGVFELSSSDIGYGVLSTTATSSWASSQWLEGRQYVTFKNVQVTNGKPVIITARQGQSGFALINGMQILGVPTVPANPLLNVNFTADKNPASHVKSGPAAVGFQADDYWNVYSRDASSMYDWRSEGTVANLRWADGSASSANISVTNAAGFWTSGASDAMLNTYLYPLGAGPISIYVRKLPAGYYNIQLYGHGPVASQNGVFELSSAGVNYGVLSTTTSSGWTGAQWIEGQQYVTF